MARPARRAFTLSENTLQHAWSRFRAGCLFPLILKTLKPSGYRPLL